MHQLFGNASDIDAGSAKAPGCSDRGRLNEIAQGDLLAKVSGFLGSCKASGASADDLKLKKILRK